MNTDFHAVELLYHPAATLRLRPHTKKNYLHINNSVYAEAHGVGLVMDIFQPVTGSTGLAVIDVVSGGWHADRTMLNEHIGFGLIDALCDHGITVFAVSPGSLPLFTGLEMATHVHAAIRHIKGYAEDYGINPESLGIMGVSAGGHLAALAALSPQERASYARDPWQQHDSRVKAAALFFPPTDLLDYGGVPITQYTLEGLDLTRLLFHDGISGHSREEITRRLEDLSPAKIPCVQPPPFLIVQGKQDMIVPWKQAEKLAHTLRNAGGAIELVFNDTGGHLWPGIEREIGMATDWMAQELHK